jgi:hypothetical protein
MTQSKDNDGRFSRQCLASWLRSSLPPLLFGLRTAAAVVIALAIAFALELDEAYWAGTTAALVCQPVLGSALRKATFRMIGTLVGAVVTLLLFACFPQDRVGFTLGLAGWCAFCGFVSTSLTFFASYGAALVGYTAAIIVGDVVDMPDHAFQVALVRVTEIELGIAVATTVLAVTQFGASRKRLATTLRNLAEQAVVDLLEALAGERERPKTEEVRYQLVQLASLAQVVDQVAGEAFHWRFRLGPVRAAQGGLFACRAETELLWADRDGCPQQHNIAVVDADSFWVDAYFEETALARIHDGDPARVHLMGYQPTLRGHVDSVARGIQVADAQPDRTGLATVNPIFTWVRLAQRVPVRIELDRVPKDVRLVAGTTATVEIDPSAPSVTP